MKSELYLCTTLSQSIIFGPLKETYPEQKISWLLDWLRTVCLPYPLSHKHNGLKVSNRLWLTNLESKHLPSLGGFTLDISSALEVCLKCTWNALVCERIETGLVALDWSYLVATETSKLQRAEVRSQVWSRPYLRVHLSNQNIGS